MSAIVAATVGAVGTLAGAAISGSAAGSAAKDQENASLNAQQIQEQQYQQIQANEQPYQNLGNSAVDILGQDLGLGKNNGLATPGVGYGGLTTPLTASQVLQYNPAYTFQAEQGRQGSLNADASGAGALSGAAQKDLMSYNQNMANSAYGNALQQRQLTFSNLLSAAGVGQAAASQQAASGTALAGNAGSAAISAGNAAANGQIGTANAYSNALSGGANAYTQYAYLNALQNQGQGSFDTSGLSDINNNAFDQISQLIPAEE